MATLEQVCQAIPTALSSIANVEFYEFMPDVAVTPAVVVWPDEGQWVTMGRGTDRHEIDLYVLAPRPVGDEGQTTLRTLMHNVRATVWTNPTLGLASTDAWVSGYSRFGAQFEFASIPHVGAVLRLVVLTPGT